MKMRKTLLTLVFSLVSFSVTAQNFSGPTVAVPVPIAQGGTGSTTAAAARTALGLGTMATQAASAVAISGGTIDGTTLGATTRSTARVTTLDASSTFTAATINASSSINTAGGFRSTGSGSQNNPNTFGCEYNGGGYCLTIGPSAGNYSTLQLMQFDGAVSGQKIGFTMGTTQLITIGAGGGTTFSDATFSLTGIPTTCTSKPANSIAAVAGVLTRC